MKRFMVLYLCDDRAHTAFFDFYENVLEFVSCCENDCYNFQIYELDEKRFIYVMKGAVVL